MIGSGVSSILVTSTAIVVERIDNVDTPNYYILAGLTAFFAFFPDLDTKSTPQKWFYRSLVVVNIMLIILRKFELCSYISTVCMIPLLDKHRGITHSFILSIIAPLLLIFFYEKLLFNVDITINNIIISYSWYYIGCVFGWWTHLVLDSRLFKI